MNNKAQISGFSEMQWALLLLVILVVFAIFMNAQATAQASEVLEPISWEPQWMANSLAQHPVGNQTMLEALRDPANDQEVQSLTQRVLNNTITDPRATTWILLSREGETIFCRYQGTTQQNTVTYQCPEETPQGLQRGSDSKVSGITYGPGNVYVGVAVR